MATDTPSNGDRSIAIHCSCDSAFAAVEAAFQETSRAATKSARRSASASTVEWQWTPRTNALVEAVNYSLGVATPDSDTSEA